MRPERAVERQEDGDPGMSRGSPSTFFGHSYAGWTRRVRSASHLMGRLRVTGEEKKCAFVWLVSQG